MESRQETVQDPSQEASVSSVARQVWTELSPATRGARASKCYSRGPDPAGPSWDPEQPLLLKASRRLVCSQGWEGELPGLPESGACSCVLARAAAAHKPSVCLGISYTESTDVSLFCLVMREAAGQAWRSRCPPSRESIPDPTLQLLLREAKGASGTGGAREPSPGQGAQAGTEEATTG